MSFFTFIIGTRARNFQLMRRAAQQIGIQLERRPYEELQQASEKLSLQQSFEGKALTFSTELIARKPNGDLGFSIHVDGLPTFLGIAPSYQFFKRRDGSTYY